MDLFAQSATASHFQFGSHWVLGVAVKLSASSKLPRLLLNHRIFSEWLSIAPPSVLKGAGVQTDSD